MSQLLLNGPDLLITLGIQLLENLGGKMIITSDGSTIYALSDSGFTVLGGQLRQRPVHPAQTFYFRAQVY